VIQRLNATPAASSEHQATDETGDNGQSNTDGKDSNNGQQHEQEGDDSQDKDA
jgi:hypothetical protein